MARINMSYTRSAMHKLFVDALTEDGVACSSSNKNYDEQATYDARDTGNRGLFNIYNTRISEYQDILCALTGEKRINITEAIPAIDFFHTDNSHIMATYPVDSDGVVDSSIIEDIPYSRDPDVLNKVIFTEDPYMINRIAAGDTLSEYVYNVDTPNFADMFDLQVSGDLGETVQEYVGICDLENENYITPILYSSKPSEIRKTTYGFCTVKFTLDDTFHFVKDEYGKITEYPKVSSLYLAKRQSTAQKTEILTEETIDSQSRFTKVEGNVYSFNLTYEDHLVIAKPKSESSLGSSNFMIYTCETSATTGYFERLGGDQYRDLQGNTYTLDENTGYLKNNKTQAILDPNAMAASRKYVYYIIPFTGDELVTWNTTETESVFDTIKPRSALPKDFIDSPGYKYLLDFVQVREIHVSDASGFLLGLYSKPYEYEQRKEGNYTRVTKWRFLDDFSDKGMPIGAAYNEDHLLGRGSFLESPLALVDPVTGNNRVTLPQGFTLPGGKSLDDYKNLGLSTLIYDIVEKATQETLDSCLMPLNDWKSWTSNNTVMTTITSVVTRDDYAALYSETAGSKPNEIMKYPKKFLGVDTDLTSGVDNYIGVDPSQLEQYFANCAPKIITRTEAYEYPTEEFFIHFVLNKEEMKSVRIPEWENYFGWDPQKEKFNASGLLRGKEKLAGTRSISGNIFPETVTVVKDVKVLSLDIDSNVSSCFEANTSMITPEEDRHAWWRMRFSGRKYKDGQTLETLTSDYMKTTYVKFKADFTARFIDLYSISSLEDAQAKASPKLHSTELQEIKVLSPLEAFQKKGRKDDSILVYPTNKRYFPEKLYLITKNDVGLETKSADKDKAINPKSLVSFFSTDGQGKVMTFVTSNRIEFKLSDVDYVEITGHVKTQWEAYRNTELSSKNVYCLTPYAFGTDHDCYIYELEPFSLAGVNGGLQLSGVKVVDPLGEERNLFDGLSSLKIMPFAYPGTYFQTEKRTNAIGNLVYAVSEESQKNDFASLANSVVVPGIPKVTGDWGNIKCYDSIPVDSFKDLLSGLPKDMIIQKSLKSTLSSWPITDSADNPLTLKSLPNMLDGLMQTVGHLLNMAGENLEITYQNSSTGLKETHILSQDDLKNLSKRINYTKDLTYTLPEPPKKTTYAAGSDIPTDASVGLDKYLKAFGNVTTIQTSKIKDINLSSFLRVRNLAQGMFGENETITREECVNLDQVFGPGTYPFMSFGDVESPMDSFVRSFKLQVSNVLAPQMKRYNDTLGTQMKNALQAAVDDNIRDLEDQDDKIQQQNQATVDAYNAIYGAILDGFSLTYNPETKEVSGQLCDECSLSDWTESFTGLPKLKLKKSAFTNDPYLSSKFSELKNSFSYKVLWWRVYPYSIWSNSTFWDYFDFGRSSDAIGPADWRLLEKSRWDSTFYPGLKNLLSDYISNRAASYREQGVEVTVNPPVISKFNVKLKLYKNDGSGFNIPITNAFAAVGSTLSSSLDLVPHYTVAQMKEFLYNSGLGVFRYVKANPDVSSSTPNYSIQLPVLTNWSVNQYQVVAEVTKPDENGELQTSTVECLLGDDSSPVYKYISDLSDLDGKASFDIGGVQFTNFNDMDPSLFSGLVTFIKSALDGTPSANDTGMNPGVLNTKNDQGPLGRENSLYYQRYLVLNSRLNLANGTLTKAYNMLRNARNVEEAEVYTQNNAASFNRIMAVIPVEKMTPMTFLPAQDSASGQVRMNSKFYYTEFMEAIRTSISDKCVLTCTHCNVKDSCPFYNEEEVLKLYVPQADSIDLWIKDNELDLLWDVEDDDIVLTARDSGGTEKHLYADTFRNLHKPYAEVVKHIGTSPSDVQTYEVNSLSEVKENLAQVGDDFDRYNGDGMGWLLGGRYGTLQHNSVKSLPAEGYDSTKFPKYRYLYDAVFLGDEETYITYTRSSDAYHVALDYKGDHYEGDVHIKIPTGLKFPGGITPNAQDDVYLVSDDLVDPQGNEMTPVIYLNTVENLLFYFDLNTSHDTSDSAESSVASSASEISISSVDSFDASGNYVPTGGMSPVVSRVPRSSNDHIMYPKDVAQWCVNYAKGPCYDTPLSDDDPQNKDQFWMQNLKKKCSYQGNDYWIDVAGRPRMSSGYNESILSSEDEVNPYLVISGKPVVNSYVNFVRRLSLKLEDWVRDGDPQYVSDYEHCAIKWVKNYTDASEIERQRYVLTQMKTNLRLVLVRNS